MSRALQYLLCGNGKMERKKRVEHEEQGAGEEREREEEGELLGSVTLVPCFLSLFLSRPPLSLLCLFPVFSLSLLYLCSIFSLSFLCPDLRSDLLPFRVLTHYTSYSRLSSC